MLGSSCKSEVVYADRGVWSNPCADVLIILSDSEFMTIKSFAHRGIENPLHPPSLGMQSKPQSGDTAQDFDPVEIDIHLVGGCEIKTNKQIIEAGLDRKPLVSQTESTAESGAHILIEYPVRVWNYNERDILYQLDTEPALIPNFNREHTPLIETFERAYIAQNCPAWAEFIVNVPTKITDEFIVDHYSESRRIDQVTNRMIEVLE